MSKQFLKVADGLSYKPQASPPADPADGDSYFDSTLNRLRVYYNGAWHNVGSGEGGGINYISEPDAETPIVNWLRYFNAGSRPTTGAGGSPDPAVTWTITGTDPLRGLGSFELAKDAADRQGEGVAIDFTIDRADQSKLLPIAFDYEISSGVYGPGTPSTDSDLIAYIYRVDATGRQIEPEVFRLNGAVVGQKYRFNSWFQTDADALNYRFELHIATTNASAWTVKFDNFSIGPTNAITQNNSLVAFRAMSAAPTAASFSSADPVIFPSLGSLGFDTHNAYNTSTGVYTIPVAGIYRVACKLSIEGTYSAATGASIYLEKGPTPFAFGAQHAQSSGSILSPSVSALVKCEAGDQIHANPEMTGSGPSFTAVEYFNYFEIELVSANGSLIENEFVAFKAMDATPTCADFTSGSDAIKFASLGTHGYDTHNGYNPSTGKYTVPVKGFYQITASFGLNLTSALANYQITPYIYKAGSLVASGGRQWVTGTSYTGTLNTFIQVTVSCNAGDEIFVAPVTNTNTGTTFFTSEQDNYLEVRRVDNVQVVQPDSKVIAIYKTGSGQSIPTGATFVNYDTKVKDTHNAVVTGASWKFYAPRYGFYRIDARVTWSGADATGNRNILVTDVNGVYYYGNYLVVTDSNIRSSHVGSAIFELKSGDWIAVTVENSGGTDSLYTDDRFSQIFIEELKG